MSDLSHIDFGNLTLQTFEEVLPDLFAAGQGKVSEDPRLTSFLAANPDCAALVRDLEYIAEAARKCFSGQEEPEPRDELWDRLQAQLAIERGEA